MESFHLPSDAVQLSIGMSNDFEYAVSEASRL